MDLDFSEEQVLLRDTLRQICADQSPLTTVRAVEDTEQGYAPAFWEALGEAGVCGLRIPETFGGVGLGVLDTVVVYEELGRGLVPSPHFESALLAARLLVEAGDEAQGAAWLPGIADASRVVIPSWQEHDTTPDLESIRTTATVEGDVLIVNGRKWLVPFASSADQFLVLTRHPTLPGDCLLAMVPATAEGVRRRLQSNHAGAPLFAVDFEQVRVPLNDSLGLETGVDDAWRRVFLESLVPLAAQAIGGAEQMLAMTTEYACLRIQFDRPIGSFQAIAHALADRATELEGAKLLVYQAAWAIDQGLPYERLALMAKLKACATFRKMTAVGTQIHGGIGFTSEADPQLYFRRAKHQQLMYGDPGWLEEQIAACVVNGDIPTLD